MGQGQSSSSSRNGTSTTDHDIHDSHARLIHGSSPDGAGGAESSTAGTWPTSGGRERLSSATTSPSYTTPPQGQVNDAHPAHTKRNTTHRTWTSSHPASTMDDRPAFRPKTGSGSRQRIDNAPESAVRRRSGTASSNISRSSSSNSSLGAVLSNPFRRPSFLTRARTPSAAAGSSSPSSFSSAFIPSPSGMSASASSRSVPSSPSSSSSSSTIVQDRRSPAPTKALSSSSSSFLSRLLPGRRSHKQRQSLSSHRQVEAIQAQPIEAKSTAGSSHTPASAVGQHPGSSTATLTESSTEETRALELPEKAEDGNDAKPSASGAGVENGPLEGRRAESPYVPGVLPSTPEEEQDAMFAERQRARQLIQAALAQSRAEISDNLRALPSAQATSRQQSHLGGQIAPTSTQVDSAAAAGGGADSVSPPAEIAVVPSLRTYAPLPRRGPSRPHSPQGGVVLGPTALALPDGTTASVASEASSAPATSAVTTTTATGATANASPDSILPAPVPPSELTSAPTTPIDGAPLAGQQSGSESARPLNSSDSGTTANPTNDALLSLLVPRRILVQGVVAQSALPSPQASRPSTPSQQPQPSRTLSRRPSQAMEVEDNNSTNADAGPTTLQANRTRATNEEEQGDQVMAEGHRVAGSDWDDAVRELLDLPIDRPSPAVQARRDTAPPLPQDTAAGQASSSTAAAEASSSAAALQHQAQLIARLLSIAAAATAATLLPGSIVINGAPVAGFEEGGLLTNPFAGPSAFPAAGSADPSSSAPVPTASAPLAPSGVSDPSPSAYPRE